jgi:hypothetical protein
MKNLLLSGVKRLESEKGARQILGGGGRNVRGFQGYDLVIDGVYFGN